MKPVTPELPEKLKKLLLKQQYRFVGKHSAVKICSWTKKSITNQGVCYKEKFYGIRCHLCCQMSPSVGFCQNRCVFCWRDMDNTIGYVMDEKKSDNPNTIVNEFAGAQKELLIGFKGNDKADVKKFKSAMEPMHFAISLTGEPTSYPHLSKLIKGLHKKGKTTFLVTNGQLPDVLKKLEMPTQLYLSVDAPNKNLFQKIERSIHKDAWERFNKSLDLIKKLKKKTRTTLRLTLIKEVNMVHPKQWADLILKSDPMFVEVKAYMYVGSSQRRLEIKNMPYHEDVVEFAKKICKYSGYKIIDEQKSSRVVLLMKEDFPGRIMKFKD